MSDDKYFWINRASEHHIRRMASLVGLTASPKEILATGEPRYISHKVATLLSADGHRQYDFLIEYDIYNPSQGIYFGCKSVTLPNFNHKSETANALVDWQQAQPYVTLRLNNVFIDKDFDFRYKATDNDTGNTFWPFWISLYEDESPVNVAVRALQIIAGIYDELISGQLPDINVCPKSKSGSVNVQTAFTYDAYDNFIRKIEKYISEVSSHNLMATNAELGRKFIENFLAKAESHQLIHRAPNYEYAWKMDSAYNDVDFKAMLNAIIEELQKNIGISGMKTPWNDAIRIFMRSDERPYKLQIKTLAIKRDTAERISALVKTLAERE